MSERTTNKTVVKYGVYIQDESHEVVRADVKQMLDRELFSLDAKVGAVQGIIREECDRRITKWHAEGLTQRAIAERAGCGQATVSRTYTRLGLESVDNRGGDHKSGLIQADQNHIAEGVEADTDRDEPTGVKPVTVQGPTTAPAVKPSGFSPLIATNVAYNAVLGLDARLKRDAGQLSDVDATRRTIAKIRDLLDSIEGNL
jgi:hypothetical protein